MVNKTLRELGGRCRRVFKAHFAAPLVKDWLVAQQKPDLTRQKLPQAIILARTKSPAPQLSL